MKKIILTLTLLITLYSCDKVTVLEVAKATPQQQKYSGKYMVVYQTDSMGYIYYSTKYFMSKEGVHAFIKTADKNLSSWE